MRHGLIKVLKTPKNWNSKGLSIILVSIVKSAVSSNLPKIDSVKDKPACAGSVCTVMRGEPAPSIE